MVEGAEAVLPHQPHRLCFSFQSQQTLQPTVLKVVSVTLSNSSVSSVVYKMSYFVVFARPCYTEAKCIESVC